MNVRNFPWFGVLVTLSVVSFLGGLGWLVWLDIDSYRQECHQVGGHIINVQHIELCVDYDNRVIVL